MSIETSNGLQKAMGDCAAVASFRKQALEKNEPRNLYPGCAA
jgi:hypothetical protein